MGKILNNTDFFSKKPAPAAPAAKAPAPQAPGAKAPAPAAKAPAQPSQPVKVAPQPAPKAAPIRLDAKVTEAVRVAAQTLKQVGQPALAQNVEQAYKSAVKDRFSVAVVGEFSRGKSTFLNTLLNQELLPVGNLPTTAILTRIRYHQPSTMVYINPDKKQKTALPLSLDSWNNLVADNFNSNNDPTGLVVIGLDDPWLQQNNIELMDTPGAGDLEQERAKVIGEALLGADGAIITISALQAMSMSEQLFIEQRLISRNTPFLMLILTKLDQIPVKERPIVIEFVKNKLANMNVQIPVFIPYEVEMPNEDYKGIMGIDKVKAHITSWICHPLRRDLTQQWLLSKLLTEVETGRAALVAKKQLLEGTDEERQEKIRKKEEGLSKAQIAWEEMRLQLLERCNQCYKKLLAKANEYSINITERLQYEATMCGAPQKWWTESYPYRLKIELTNMANSIDNLVSKAITEDARWFNNGLEQQFRTHVMISQEPLSEKSVFDNLTPRENVTFEDLDRQRNAAKIGTTLLTIGGAILCSSLGAFPLIATMGIGTGSSIVTEGVFKGKIEKQRVAIKEAVAKNVPELINQSMENSEKRLQTVYNDIVNEAKKQEEVWMQTQKEAIIQSANQPSDPAAVEALAKQLGQVDALHSTLTSLQNK